MQNLFNTLEKILSQDERFVTNEGQLLRNAVFEAAMKMDEPLLKVLLNNEETRKNFFKEIEVAGNKTLVFDKVGFGWVINNKEFLPDSYTRYKNKIGLVDETGRFIANSGDVELVFPYKDCVLVGGQTKEEQKRSEIFFNKKLAPDEVDRLLAPKVMVNAKRYTKDGVEKVTSFAKDDNLIIKGNNLLGLSSLVEFYDKIKSIFIDPPYYFSINKPTDTFSYNSNFKLSSWLVFLNNRLQFAKKLLKSDGVIFITMNDDGAHYLKVMCDGVFGEENFIADVTWEARKSISSDSLMSINHNHVLIYSKNKSKISKNNFRLALDIETFTEDDNDGKGKYRLEPFDAPNVRTNLNYEIKNPNTGESYLPPTGRCWRTEESKYFKLLEKGSIRFGVRGNAKPQLKVYYEDVKNAGKGKASSSIWHDVGQSIIWQNLDTNTNATKSQMALFGESVFTNPKPEDLIQRVLELSTNKGDLVLDFFLGSGTTAAVAHKMGRKYIGIEQMDYIDDVVIKRLQKVIGGEQTGISQSVNWQGGGSFVYCELAQLNEKYVEAVQKATTDAEVTKILQEVLATGFISDKVNPKLIDTDADDYKALSLDEKKKFVMEVLDSNMLYVNYSDIDDKEFNISESDKAFNKSFYGEE